MTAPAAPPPLRALLVDDERLARAQLRQMLRAHPEVEVVGEAESAGAALEVARRSAPDVLFLDVQMPGEGGFELLARLPPPAPRVVFVTAFDAFAVRAFEVNALDYLLKPVRPERLARAVARLARAAPAEAEEEADAPDGRPLDFVDRLFLTLAGAAQFVQVADLSCLTAADDYCELHLRDGRSGLVLSSLRTWERRLPARHFVRVHRSAIIQYGAVQRLEPWTNGGFLVHLAGVARPVTISRRYAAELRDRLR